MGLLDDAGQPCDPQDHWLPEALVIPLHLMASCGCLGSREVGCSLGLKNWVNEMSKDTEAGHNKNSQRLLSTDYMPGEF